ncbi:MAG: hypothetical protein A2289_20235 [Deltaproteobacteria bacterium RIFOXYA12_FULL_58_15]|nr:MAG: hypothetical protein A2289_20235 [Deltaproteobacteria bacterium RIFOXYA12_FULL_58_15]OGR07175.1 MAG: hypothetical protein A2341_03535 [Deltaproteobacteria bacterium RIFOXYB12_FULL_58_9]
MRTIAICLLMSASGFACEKSEPRAAVVPQAKMPALPAVAGGEISGSIAIAKELEQDAKAGDAIFVMARNAATGSLVAVTRVQASEFPIAFQLEGNAAMHNNTALAGKVRLEVRLDKDGDAMTREAGDLVGEVAQLVPIPTNDVVVTLSEKL